MPAGQVAPSYLDFRVTGLIAAWALVPLDTSRDKPRISPSDRRPIWAHPSHPPARQPEPMPVNEDLLFCKIAISSGLVKETDAQKVLSLCEKRERETGRRPLIGTVFEKYNLLGKQDVQRVYQAIKKRTGGAAGTERITEQARTRGAGSKKRAAAIKPKGKIDQNTLVIGIGSLVAVLGIIVFILIKVMQPKGGAEAPVAKQEPGVEASSSASGIATPSAPKPAPKPEPKGPVDAPKEIVGELVMLINDQRSESSDHPDAALKKLLEEKAKLEKRNFNLPKQLVDAIKDFEGLVKEAKAAGAEPKPEEKAETKPDAKPDAKPEAKPDETPPAEPDAAKPAGDDAKPEEPKAEGADSGDSSK